MKKELFYQVPLQHKIVWLISSRLYNNVHVFILHIRRCHGPKVSNFDAAASGNIFDLNVCIFRFEHDSRCAYVCTFRSLFLKGFLSLTQLYVTNHTSLCSDQCSSVKIFCVKTHKSSVFSVAM